ncbi:MAG: peptidoglycan DD-metalloendopeptidase family protein, partial [Rhodobacteraceae bacterium]|nr:peptidoglycan DD-metalloendopeptidase family protein [Paracoccaceae bacterium]
MLNAESLAIHAPYSPNISSNGILGIKVTQGSWLSPSATTHANTGSKTGDSSAFDFGLVRDTKILSMAFGIVVAVEGNWDDGTFIKHSWGNYVTVLHVAPRLDGTGVEVFYATYAHLGKAERPNVLDFVNAGDIIGHVGETGESHGAHLHVQIGTERDGTMADGSPTPENQALLERLFFVGYQYDENGTRVDLTPLSQLDEGEYVRSVNGIQTVIEPIPNSDGVGGVGDVADLAFAFVGLGDDFANKGSSIDFIANVENLGDLSSGQTSVRLVITSTPEDSSSWRELGDFSIDALSNASGLNSIDYLSSSFDLPNDLVGDFFVGFIIDPDDNVPEVHEWNNINWSPITVVDPNNSFVDLMGLDVDVDGNTFDVGDTFEFTVDYTNLGNGLAGYFDIAVYLSPTESTEDGILLFEETGFETPDPGETLTEYFNAYTNGKWYSGTYNILVEFDSGDDIAEPNDANNVAMGTIYLNGITPKPDVAFSGYSSGTANRTLEQGGTFSTYFEVTNSNFGQSDFGGPTSAQIVFSADQNISNDDIFLGDFHIPDLSVGENVVFLNAEVALPSNMTLGDYYVAVVLDPDDLINEVYEDNNTAWYTHTFEVVAPASLPDMSVSNLEVVLRSDGSGLYDATFTVHNNGGDLQGAGVILRLSPTQNISWENSYALGGDVTGSLDSGNSVELSISGVDLDWVQNYSGFTPGTYYFAVEVDYSGFVDELNELNNISNLVAIELELPVLSSSGVLGETGTLTLNHTASTVTLQHSYDNPVVIAFIATENGNQPVNVRVTDIGGDQLSLQLQEPNYLDGSHAKETVHYLV